MPKPVAHAFASKLTSFKTASGKSGQLFSLPELAIAFPNVARMPISMRIVPKAGDIDFTSVMSLDLGTVVPSLAGPYVTESGIPVKNGEQTTIHAAAEGAQLRGIKAVVAKSFERIHRSNLIGKGVLPLQFKPGTSWEALCLTGAEVIDITLADEIAPQGAAVMTITRPDDTQVAVKRPLRIDTAIEVDYYFHGGILPFVLKRQE